MTDADFRPLTAEDAPAAAAILMEAFAAATRARGEEPHAPTEERKGGLVRRLARFTRTDGPGCWAAEVDGALVGYAVAMRRDDLWGLAQLFVHPDHQSRRLGSRLLERVRPSADGATIEVIQASEDPRAIRRYASLGLALHPAVGVKGEVDRSVLPSGLPVRDGTVADLDLVDTVDRPLRGVPRTTDVEALLRDDALVLTVADGANRGFAVHTGKGSVTMLGADDEVTARSLLWACLAEAEDTVEQWGWTATQGWAIEVSLAAGLNVIPAGPMFLRGLPAFPGPYLPSGLYF